MVRLQDERPGFEYELSTAELKRLFIIVNVAQSIIVHKKILKSFFFNDFKVFYFKKK